MNDKVETFLITVSILEGRHYIWTNMDSAVIIKVDNKKRCTTVKRSTDSPVYNEYFVFEFSTTLDNIMEKNITITVIQPRSFCRKRKVLGDFTLDVATLWTQESRQFYHKWAILTKNDQLAGPRGYLKVDISLLFKGQISKLPTDRFNDEIEGNLLLPDGLYRERQKALYLFNIYRGDKLESRPSIAVNEKTSSKGPSTYVEVTFAGQTVRTSVKKNTNCPVFCEQLTIIDLFPPLCQRIKIEICYSESCKKTTNAARYLELKYISNDKEEGFLPTFGPTFLHMYFNNSLGGFAGKILVSMDTELQEILPTDVKTTGTIVKSIPPIYENMQFDDVVLFGMIFGATAISKGCCDRTVSFRITFGSALLQKSTTTSGENSVMNSTVAFKPKKISNNYFYLPLEGDKPCLVITRQMPSCRKRMYNANMLSKMAKEIKERLRLLEDEFQSRHYKLSCAEVYEILEDTLDFVRSSGKKYIDIVEEYNFESGTKLDRERKKMCLKEMRNILEKVNRICKGKTRIQTLGKIEKLCNRIEQLVFDIQDCWPDIHIWMIFGNKKTACCRIQSREILFSPIEEEKGEYCGKMKTILLYPHSKDNKHLSCKMDVLLWLGVDRHKNDCYSSIPEGFDFDEETVLETRKIYAQEKYVFILRAHIFQGKISPGFDRSGLADSSIRVLIRDKQGETRVITSKLNPLWDQTIVLSDLIFFGSKSFLRENIPTVLLELLDKDQCTSDDSVGRNLVTPVIKFREDPYLPPEFPPKLKWIKTFQGVDMLGEILATFEYIETPLPGDDFQLPPKQKIYRVPDDIKPHMVPHRVEILFWGVRDLGKLYCKQITRPRMTIICEEGTLMSDTIENVKKHSNFSTKCKSMDVVLPLEKEYTPPLCMKIHDSRRFGIYFFAGVHISDVHSYKYYPITKNERNRRLSQYSLVRRMSSSILDEKPKIIDFKQDLTLVQTEGEKKLKAIDRFKCYIKSLCTFTKSESVPKKPHNFSKISAWFKNMYKISKLTTKGKKSLSSLGTYEPLLQEESEDEDFDWWTKFYASLENPDGSLSDENSGPAKINMSHCTVPSQIDQNGRVCHCSKKKILTEEDGNKLVHRHTLKIYPNELEDQPEFNEFTDMFSSFEMYKGKRTGDEAVDEENITAVFKGCVKIYCWPLESSEEYVTDRGLPLQDGLFQNYPDNMPVRFLLRVYCIQGISLRPKDRSGKSDPYLLVTLGNREINDRENYISRQVNPVFGRFFELNGNFPNDHTLIVSVWDYDALDPDDLIGQTEIDIENRFYSKHRAFCGIADHYTESGYCAWRGRQKPTTILHELCKTWGLETPEYQEDSVRIGLRQFVTEDFIACGNTEFDREVLSLTALRRWNEMPVVGFPVVPEHVETRSLYHPSKPGIEQGKIQMWIDIFPTTDLPPPKSVEVTPRKPVEYELRVIIWNTEDVELSEDDFFLGERKSDIYVKGWVTDSREAQCTDVHYKSLSGEGNFNWRFIFPFEYLTAENKLLVRRKESIFAIDETEFKLPCKLTLQVWDNDTFSRDDFLGTLSLELSRMPRGARVASKCTLSILEPHAPRINVFKVRRAKGWWPFRRYDQTLGKYTLQGKVEAELELVTFEEAKQSPAGLGHHHPQALPEPKRPDVSFSWFRNPLKAIKYVICKLHRWKIISACLFILLVVLILVAVYSIPGYIVKRILGA